MNNYKKAPSIKYLNLLKQIKIEKKKNEEDVNNMFRNIGPRAKEELDKAINEFIKPKRKDTIIYLDKESAGKFEKELENYEKKRRFNKNGKSI